MSDSPTEPLHHRYQTAIAQLQTVLDPTPPIQTLLPYVLEILAARDQLHTLLQQSTPISGETLTAIAHLDQQLQAQAAIIESALKSIDWQTSFSPAPTAWWWSLNVKQPNPWWNQDWLWQAISIICLTISLGLFGDISSRFLKDGPDTFGAIAVSTQSILTLLTAGGALTVAGQEANKRILNQLHIPEDYWHELGAGFSVLLLCGAVGLRQSLPQIASWYSNWGFNHYSQGDWGTAEDNYQRALQLNPDSDQTHFRLGLLYEELQDSETARTHYQLAAHDDRPDAINNLARLNLLDKKPDRATPFLLKALENPDKLPAPTHYAMLKNLGWARLQQGDYSEAASYLKDAIAVQKTIQSAEIPGNPKRNTTLAIASPYCLLAQVNEAQGHPKAALSAWDTCIAMANPYIPEENTWAIIGRKKLYAEDRQK